MGKRNRTPADYLLPPARPEQDNWEPPEPRDPNTCDRCGEFNNKSRQHPMASDDWPCDEVWWCAKCIREAEG